MTPSILKQTVSQIALAVSRVSFTAVLHAMLIGKTIEEAKAVKEDYLAAYNEAIVPIRGRISAEYRKKVCVFFV